MNANLNMKNENEKLKNMTKTERVLLRMLNERDNYTPSENEVIVSWEKETDGSPYVTVQRDVFHFLNRFLEITERAAAMQQVVDHYLMAFTNDSNALYDYISIGKATDLALQVIKTILNANELTDEYFIHEDLTVLNRGFKYRIIFMDEDDVEHAFIIIRFKTNQYGNYGKPHVFQMFDHDRFFTEITTIAATCVACGEWWTLDEFFSNNGIFAYDYENKQIYHFDDGGVVRFL